MHVIESHADEIKTLEGRLRREARHARPLQVLEAGCGREWYFQLDGIDLTITGVDLDAAALAHRRNVTKDLDHAVTADLRTVALPENFYDVVYTSFVLEHVDGAELALDRMVASMKPGALLIVRVPDVDGAQAFLARRLPHALICFYYRRAWGIKDAGKPGFAPYPTYYDRVISREGFRSYCNDRGLDLEEEFGVGSYARRGSGLMARLTPFVTRIVSKLTGGRAHDCYVDLTFVARKRLYASVSAEGSAAGVTP